MSRSPEDALKKLIELVTHAEEMLCEAEGIFYSELAGTFEDNDFSYAVQFEEVLEGATHEAASSLGFYLHDIKTLLPRIQMRKEYPQLTNAEFVQIVTEEWSILLVKKIHEQLENKNYSKLLEVSELIKEIQFKWSNLPS